jgi:prepilin peptidase CpaA
VTITAVAVVATGVVACLCDLSTRRVPNVLTFGTAAAALVVAFATGGWTGFGMAAAGWGVGCALFLPWFLLGGMGAGDVKLLAGLGAWLGPTGALWAALLAGVAGGPLALIVAATKGYVRQSFTNLWGLLMFWRVAGIQPLPTLTLRTAQSPRLPYALPISVGAGLALWLRWL